MLQSRWRRVQRGQPETSRRLAPETCQLLAEAQPGWPQSLARSVAQAAAPRVEFEQMR